MTVPLYNLTDTWNDSGTVFTGLKLTVTNTASAAGSLLMDLRVGGTTAFSVDAAGSLLTGEGAYGALALGIGSVFNCGFRRGSSKLVMQSEGEVAFSIGAAINLMKGSAAFGFVHNDNAESGTPDTLIYRDAAGILAQRNSTNAQTLRVYNTYTDASNYERLVFDWATSANVATIDVQIAGTGTQRVISLNHLDAATAGGTATFAATNCPATTLTSPYTWIKVTSSDGSIVYMPAWK